MRSNYHVIWYDSKILIILRFYENVNFILIKRFIEIFRDLFCWFHGIAFLRIIHVEVEVGGKSLVTLICQYMLFMPIPDDQCTSRIEFNQSVISKSYQNAVIVVWRSVSEICWRNKEEFTKQGMNTLDCKLMPNFCSGPKRSWKKQWPQFDQMISCAIH